MQYLRLISISLLVGPEKPTHTNRHSMSKVYAMRTAYKQSRLRGPNAGKLISIWLHASVLRHILMTERHQKDGLSFNERPPSGDPRRS
jgi:hypothetical protein